MCVGYVCMSVSSICVDDVYLYYVCLYVCVGHI